MLIFNKLLVKKKKRNKRSKNQQTGDPTSQILLPEEEEINCENLYGLEEDELDTIEKAAKKLNDEFIDKRISHSGVWTKPLKKGAIA